MATQISPRPEQIYGEFIPFRRAEWLRRALPPPSGNAALDGAYRTPLVCAQKNDHLGRWVLHLDEERLRHVMTRSALRFVPFPFAALKETHEHMNKADVDMEWSEMGQAGLSQAIVYTSPLWVLLRTEKYNCADPLDLPCYDVVIPVHYYYRQLRQLLFIITRGDYTVATQDKLDAEVQPDWLFERSDMAKAYKLYCVKAREMRQAYVCQYRKELDFYENALAMIPRDKSHFDQINVEFVHKLEALENGSREYLDVGGQWSAWLRSVPTNEERESRSDDEHYVAMRAEAEDHHAKWLKRNTEFAREAYVDESPVSSENFAAYHKQEVRARNARIKALEAHLERQTAVQDGWLRQLEKLFTEHGKLMTMQRRALKARYAADKDTVREHLFAYTVAILNATEMMVMTLCSIPINLRKCLQTSMAVPPTELIPSHVSQARDDFAAETARRAVEQREAMSGKPEGSTDWVFPPTVPAELLQECKSGGDYERILLWLMEHWDDQSKDTQ